MKSKKDFWNPKKTFEFQAKKYLLVPAAEIRNRETDLVSGPFSWFQSRQIFHETHETEANPIIAILPTFVGSRLCFCIEKQTNQSGNTLKKLNSLTNT